MWCAFFSLAKQYFFFFFHVAAEPIFQATSEGKVIHFKDVVFAQRRSTFCLCLGVESREDIYRKAPLPWSHGLLWILPNFDLGPSMTSDPIVAAKFLCGSNK